MTYRLSDEDREALDVMGMFPTFEGFSDPSRWEQETGMRLFSTVEAIVAREVAAAKAEHSPGETCAEADERAEENWLRAEAAEAKVAAVEALAGRMERQGGCEWTPRLRAALGEARP